MLARLPGGRELGLTPASSAFHGAEAEPVLVAREIVDPAILAELSILWPARDASAAIARSLESARLCAAANGWLHPMARRRRRGLDKVSSPRRIR